MWSTRDKFQQNSNSTADLFLKGNVQHFIFIVLNAQKEKHAIENEECCTPSRTWILFDDVWHFWSILHGLFSLYTHFIFPLSLFLLSVDFARDFVVSHSYAHTHTHMLIAKRTLTHAPWLHSIFNFCWFANLNVENISIFIHNFVAHNEIRRENGRSIIYAGRQQFRIGQ